MIRRFQVPDLAPGPQEQDAAQTSIESWLAVFSRLLRMPDEQKQAIRDELDQHLRERVRDLMLAGENETHALHRALDELGSAAELAERMRIANRPPTRRLVMSFAAIGTGTVAVVAATLLVSGTSRPNVEFYRPPAVVVDERSALEDLTVSVTFKESPLADVLGYFAEVLDTDVVVHWSPLSEDGITEEMPVTLTLQRPRPVSQVLKLISEKAAIQPDMQSLDWRFGDNLLEFSTRAYFDRRELSLATFELRDALAVFTGLGCDRQQSATKVCELVWEYVEPDTWQANGGNVAHLTVTGTKMFVMAPARYHSQIQWILGELSQQQEPARDGDGGR